MTSPTAASEEVPTEPFRCTGLRGEIVARHRPDDLAGELARLIDSGSALETLHWGRNYIYRTRLATPDGPLEVAVKQFRHDRKKARLRRRLSGSKAAKSWRVARQMVAAGIATPEPILLADSEQLDEPSYFVTRHLDDAFEARYLLRALAAGRAAEEFPRIDPELFLTLLARLLRRLHDSGFWHRDVSSGNVLVRTRDGADGGGDRPPELFLIDLNRTRRVRRLGRIRRSRDLCRLMIFRRGDQQRFLDVYWNGRAGALERGLYRLFHDGFLLKNRVKAGVRGALRGVGQWLRDLVLPRPAHPHIPAAPEGTASRDRVVWDHLSDQPHIHTGKLAKLKTRLGDAGAHAEALAAAARAAPRIRRRYRRLAGELYRRPVPWGGLGVCLRPAAAGEDLGVLLDAVDGLGVHHLLLRLHPWQRDHTAEEELARELAGRGYDLAFSLPQNRELVRDPERWRAAVAELGERFLPYGGAFQIGQAINRSKWGVWTPQEYLRLAAIAGETLRSLAGSRGREPTLLGPAVIDFELHATAAALNLPAPGVRFDAVASLLYVDRRGAPENRQAGLDTTGKVTLVRAIADTANNVAGSPEGDARSWITEVNWPLREGPHAPAGRSVSVDEETQADYLVRYYLAALGTGLAERVYWWQLVARGYGLATREEDGSLRLRPSYRALATLARELDGCTFTGPLDPPGLDGAARVYRFETPDGGERLVAWSLDGNGEVELPDRPRRVVGRNGEELPAPAGARLAVDGSPRYVDLD